MNKTGFDNSVTTKVVKTELASTGFNHPKTDSGQVEQTMASLVERMHKWGEQKNQRLLQKQQEAEKARREQEQQLLMKPQKTKPKIEEQSEIKKDRGYQKFLEHKNYCAAVKEEKKQREEQVFKSGKNWTPITTAPVTPKLSSQQSIASLRKPLDPHQSLTSTLKSQISNTQSTSSIKSYHMLAQQEPYLQLEDNLNFEECQVIIHNHIRNLDTDF